jgi:rhodanese-related sulfurtransferase
MHKPKNENLNKERKMKKLLLIGALMLVSSFATNVFASDYCAKSGGDFCISTETAYDMVVNEDAILLDVRTPEEWKYVGVPGPSKAGEGTELIDKVEFINFKEDSFLKDVNEVFEDNPDVTIVTMCRSGGRSYYAAQAMIAEGYNVYSMTDGFEGDKDYRGYRVVNGWKVLGYSYKY